MNYSHLPPPYRQDPAAIAAQNRRSRAAERHNALVSQQIRQQEDFARANDLGITVEELRRRQRDHAHATEQLQQATRAQFVPLLTLYFYELLVWYCAQRATARLHWRNWKNWIRHPQQTHALIAPYAAQVKRNFRANHGGLRSAQLALKATEPAINLAKQEVARTATLI